MFAVILLGFLHQGGRPVLSVLGVRIFVALVVCSGFAKGVWAVFFSFWRGIGIMLPPGHGATPPARQPHVLVHLMVMKCTPFSPVTCEFIGAKRWAMAGKQDPGRGQCPEDAAFHTSQSEEETEGGTGNPSLVDEEAQKAQGPPGIG